MRRTGRTREWDVQGPSGLPLARGVRQPQRVARPRTTRSITLLFSMAAALGLTGYFLSDQDLTSIGVGPVAERAAPPPEESTSGADQFGGTIKPLQGGFAIDGLADLDAISPDAPLVLLPEAEVPVADAVPPAAEPETPAPRIALLPRRRPVPEPVAIAEAEPEAVPVAATPSPAPEAPATLAIAELQAPDVETPDRLVPPAVAAAVAPEPEDDETEPLVVAAAPAAALPEAVADPAEPVAEPQPIAGVETAAEAEADPGPPVEAVSAPKPENTAVAEPAPAADPALAIEPQEPEISGAPPPEMEAVLKRISESVKVASKANREAAETAARIRDRFSTERGGAPGAAESAPDPVPAAPSVAANQQTAPSVEPQAAPTPEPQATPAARQQTAQAVQQQTVAVPATQTPPAAASATVAAVEPTQQSAPVAQPLSCDEQLRADLVTVALIFPPLSTEIDEKYGATIRALVRRMDSCPRAMIDVRGHADATTEGEEEDSVDLSRERAEEVVSALVQAGLSQRRVRAMAFADRVPLVTPEAGQDTSVNRRVEFSIRTRLRR